MKWNEAVRLLEECEQKLRKLVAEAVGDGDYASVLRVTDLAKAVAALAAEGRSTQQLVTSTASSAKPAGTSSTAIQAPGKSPGSLGLRARPALNEYPQF